MEDIGLDSAPLVLDGAFGTLLATLGFPTETDPLWSGGAIIEAPEIVQKAHQMFIEAGADIIETNTYHTCIPKLKECRKFNQEQADGVLQKAVQIARDAITASGRSVHLVGSVGPYATYLRDGSEYTGAYVKKPDFKEQVIAVGVNCTAPEHITELLEEASRAGNRKAMVVYPNSGEIWNPETQQFYGPTQIDMIASLIPHWYSLGARIFGGCCRVTPAHIGQMAKVCEQLKAAKNKK